MGSRALIIVGWYQVASTRRHTWMAHAGTRFGLMHSGRNLRQLIQMKYEKKSPPNTSIARDQVA